MIQIGVREGVVIGQESTLQEFFDEGFTSGVENGFSMGFSLGLVTGLEDLLSKNPQLFPEALKEEIVKANTELNELFNGRSAILQKMKVDVQEEVRFFMLSVEILTVCL